MKCIADVAIYFLLASCGLFAQVLLCARGNGNYEVFFGNHGNLAQKLLLVAESLRPQRGASHFEEEFHHAGVEVTREEFEREGLSFRANHKYGVQAEVPAVIYSEAIVATNVWRYHFGLAKGGIIVARTQFVPFHMILVPAVIIPRL